MRARHSVCLVAGFWAWAVAGFVLQASAQSSTATGHAGDYERADIEYGYRLFGELCAGCHGLNGDAVPSANLRGGQFRHAETDADLQAVIVNGIAGTPMPPHDALAKTELVALVAFLRNMRDFDSGDVVLGDRTRGREVFQGKGGCTSCHRVGATGSRIAPNLSAIGSVRTPAALERAVLDPAASMLPVNRSIRAVRSDGSVVRGRRLNEDTFSVQVIDEDERLISLDKTKLREYEVLDSQMPSYRGKLSPQELAGVLSYLVSLKGL